MAVRKPLVILNDNNVSELPAGDTLPGVGDGVLDWLTVSVNTTMNTNTAYNVSGARNMTVGTAVVGNNYIVHAVDATVRVIAGAGREIRYANASVVSGATDALTLAKGETVWLVCNATNKLEIV